MDLSGHVKNNKREETVEEKALDSRSPSLKATAVTQYREKDIQVKISEKRRKKKVCGEIRDRSSRGATGYEDSLQDHKETTLRQRTEPRSHYKGERLIYHH